MENILLGLTTAIAPANLLACLLGTCLGIAFGAMPGLSATIGIAVLIPVSYGMEPATGLILLAGVYVGATYGGSISALLVNTPGTPSAAATSWDVLGPPGNSTRLSLNPPPPRSGAPWSALRPC